MYVSIVSALAAPSALAKTKQKCFCCSGVSQEKTPLFFSWQQLLYFLRFRAIIALQSLVSVHEGRRLLKRAESNWTAPSCCGCTRPSGSRRSGELPDSAPVFGSQQNRGGGSSAFPSPESRRSAEDKAALLTSVALSQGMGHLKGCEAEQLVKHWRNCLKLEESRLNFIK